jgi:hypothetical protein
MDTLSAATHTAHSQHHAHPACRCREEKAMLEAYATQRGCGTLAPRKIRLADVSSVQIAGVNDAATVFVVPVTKPGPLVSDDLPQVARDIFSLSLALAVHPEAEAVLLFLTASARDSAAGWARRIAGDHALTLAVLSDQQ